MKTSRYPWKNAIPCSSSILEGIASRLTPVQLEIGRRLVLRGWDTGHLYHRSLSFCRPYTPWTQRCPIKVTPSGKIRKG